MDVIIPVIGIFLVVAFSYLLLKQLNSARRTAYIDSYVFPQSVRNKVAETYPHLNESELDQVIRGLKDYFHMISLSHRQMVSMPSQVVDVAWHEFILFTRAYAEFCSKGLGRFLHHTPAEAMKSKADAQIGIRRAWRIACHRESINPHAPRKLPVIFALDARLKIEDGFHYELDCMKEPRSTDGAGDVGGGYCGSHIGCASGCAGSAGDGGCTGDSGGGGCGGD